MFAYAAPSLTSLLAQEIELTLAGQGRTIRATLAAVEAGGIWTGAKGD